jgi:hypothetical protein
MGSRTVSCGISHKKFEKHCTVGVLSYAEGKIEEGVVEGVFGRTLL